LKDCVCVEGGVLGQKVEADHNDCWMAAIEKKNEKKVHEAPAVLLYT
jgi:hypothetical protein